MSNFDDYSYPYLAYATSVKKCPAGQKCINYDRNGCKQCSGSGSGGSTTPGVIDKLLNVGGSGGGATVDPNKSVHEAFWDQFTGGAKGTPVVKGGGTLGGVAGAILQGKTPTGVLSDKEINESVGNRPDFLSTLGGDGQDNPFDFANIDWNKLTTDPTMYGPLLAIVGGIVLMIMIMK